MDIMHTVRILCCCARVGIATSIVLVTAKRPADLVQGVSTNALARGMGLNQDADGLVDWDVFDAMMSPGKHL